MIGKDIVLRDNSVELSLAIRSMLQGSLDYAIAALKTMQVMVSGSCDLPNRLCDILADHVIY